MANDKDILKLEVMEVTRPKEGVKVGNLLLEKGNLENDLLDEIKFQKKLIQESEKRINNYNKENLIAELKELGRNFLYIDGAVKEAESSHRSNKITLKRQKSQLEELEDALLEVKQTETKDKDILSGGESDNVSVSDLAKKYNVSTDIIEAALDKGRLVEMEHTDNPVIAYEIAKDHVAERLDYYDRLEEMENNTDMAQKEAWEMTRDDYGYDQVKNHGSKGRTDILNKAHYEYVKQAISEGKPVPSQVLAEYPELKLVNKKEAESLNNDKEEANKSEIDFDHVKVLYNQKTLSSTKEQVIYALQQPESNRSEEIKAILYNWEGFGANYKAAETKTGGLHEFFTPYWLCYTIRAIVESLGIKTDKVLDPATGTGRLLRYVNAKEIHAFEINEFNYKITKWLFPTSNIYNQAFETAFLKAPRYNSLSKESWLGNDFDLVISNPPYGEYKGEYKSYMPKLFIRFEFLFVYLSMSLVKSGGYGIFVLPQSFMNNGNMYNFMKEKIMEDNKFVDAIRLPNGIFKKTDIGVDLIILQKK